MYKLVEIGPEERNQYDELIKKFPQCDFMQSYSWGELKKGTSWDPIRILIYKGHEVKGAASILKKGIPFANKTFLYIPRGPLLEDYEDTTLFEAFFDKVKEIGQREKAIFIKFDPDIHGPSPALKGYLKAQGFKPSRKRGNFNGIQPQHVCRLYIDKAIDEVFQGLSSKTRYNIRLAEKKGVQVIEGAFEDLPRFYEILQDTCKRDHFQVRALSYFEDMYNHFVIPGRGKLLLASHNGEYIAGVFIIFHGPKAWYLYGASSNQHRNLMPNYLLQWTAISEAHQRGCKLYDFLGVASSFDPTSPLYGMYRFKRGFNPEVVEFIGEYDYPLNLGLYRLWNIVEPTYILTRVELERLAGYLRSIRAKDKNRDIVTG